MEKFALNCYNKKAPLRGRKQVRAACSELRLPHSVSVFPWKADDPSSSRALTTTAYQRKRATTSALSTSPPSFVTNCPARFVSGIRETPSDSFFATHIQPHEV